MPDNKPIKLFCRKCGQKLDLSLLEPFTRAPCPVCGALIRVPKRFDRYLLEKICGIGGMSVVYRAIDQETSRRVAIKILNSELHQEYKGGDQFLYEAKLVARINHPGVIPIYDCGIYDKQPFLSMRYMEQGSLEGMLKARVLPELPVVINWFITIADGLREALSLDIVHHDIKPGNILVADDGGAGLGDFDLADVRENPESMLASTGWASPGYVSPERLYSGAEDYQGDIFSLGVTMYEVFTAILPFGIKGEAEELISRRKHRLYQPVSDVNPQVSPTLSMLIDRMMSFETKNRPEYPEIIEVLRAQNAGKTRRFLDLLRPSK